MNTDDSGYIQREVFEEKLYHIVEFAPGVIEFQFDDFMEDPLGIRVSGDPLSTSTSTFPELDVHFLADDLPPVLDPNGSEIHSYLASSLSTCSDDIKFGLSLSHRLTLLVVGDAGCSLIEIVYFFPFISLISLLHLYPSYVIISNHLFSLSFPCKNIHYWKELVHSDPSLSILE